MSELRHDRPDVADNDAAVWRMQVPDVLTWNRSASVIAGVVGRCRRRRRLRLGERLFFAGRRLLGRAPLYRHRIPQGFFNQLSHV